MDICNILKTNVLGIIQESFVASQENCLLFSRKAEMNKKKVIKMIEIKDTHNWKFHLWF